MRWLSLLVATVFAVAGIKALFWFDPAVTALSRPQLLVISVAGAALFLYLFLRASRNQAELSELEAWLQANRAAILAGGATFQGARISGETQLTRFLLAASLVVVSFKIPSRHYIAGRDRVGLTQTAYILASLLFGWWGIPWGPIYTVQALTKNLSGGEKTTVRAYLGG